jgi:hypothetical protein
VDSPHHVGASRLRLCSACQSRPIASKRSTALLDELLVFANGAECSQREPGCKSGGASRSTRERFWVSSEYSPGPIQLQQQRAGRVPRMLLFAHGDVLVFTLASDASAPATTEK